MIFVRHGRALATPDLPTQADVRARVQAVTDKHREAVYVTHGTALSLYLASVVPNLDAFGFWTGLQYPDAWQIDGQRLVHLRDHRSPDGS